MPAELSELLTQVAQQRRAVHAMPPTGQTRPWFKVEKKTGKPRTADVWIYDAIGPSWFEDSTDAKSFTKKIAALDVDEIVLHINSPGGDFFDGAAIYNALVDHPAKVTAVIDGLAASAASFVAQAGDVRRMNRAAQMMIHDASGVVIGNAADMADIADTLNKVSDSIAGIYASRSGGTVEDWRAAMKSETWYSAQEAVEAGLADEAVDDEPSTPPVRNAWDLAVFNYAGRQAAPPPVMPSTSARPPTPASAAVDSTSPTREGAVGMPDAAKLREALGLKADASDQEVTAALAAGGFGVKAADPPTPPPPTPPAPAPQPEPQPVGDPQPQPAPAPGSQELDQKIAAAAANQGVITLDASQAAQFQEGMRRATALAAKLDERDMEETITEAVKAGKFPPARRAHYEAYWKADREGAKTLIASLAPGLIPVTASGYSDAGEDAMWESEYRDLFPPSANSGKGR